MYKLKRTVLFQVLFLFLLIFVPVTAFAAGTISIVQTSDSSFNVTANGLGAPAGFHLRVLYDNTSLTNPRVVQGDLIGSGVMFLPNILSGEVRIAAVTTNPMKGTGTIATITFDRIGASAGTITVSGGDTSPVIDLNGKNIAVTFSKFSYGPTGSSSPGTSTIPLVDVNGNTITPPRGGTGTIVGGTLTLPTDDAGVVKDRKDAPAPLSQETRDTTLPAPVQGGDTSAAQDAAPAPAPVPAKIEKYQPRSVTSVLDKFRLYTGEKTPETLAALFTRETGTPFTQTPAIAMADGKTVVAVLITKVPGDRAPNFSFNHARYVSLTQAGDGEWLMEVKPDKGAITASITMLTEGGEQLIPLVVAPRVNVDLDQSGKVNEADFQLFLKTRGTEKAPAYDLNGDGKRDYQDDYIFTANYLLAKEPKSAAAPKK